ncbi:hypothetical protein KY330_02965 [Candidatus Woesearchaeota archaeon]|nr:hypothetical protein [Candidatus Woesearchaeota archaeon]
MKKTGVILLLTFLLALIPALAVESLTDDYGNIRVTLLNQEPDPAEPGEYIELRFAVINTGRAIDSIKFRIIPEFPFSLIPGQDEIIELNDFKGLGTESKTLYYKLKVDEEAIEGTEKIKIEYKEPSKEWKTLGPYDIRIRTMDAVLGIEKIYSEPERLIPGKEGELKLKLKNFADSLLKDIHIGLSLSSSSFSPVSSTNERVIKQMAPGDEKTINFNLMPDADAEAKIHKVPLTILYRDELGNIYWINNTIGIFVDGEPEYLVAIEDSEVYESGKKGKLVLSISNIGPSEIKYLTMEVKESEDYEVISTRQEYIGNIESDDFETAEFEIHISAVKKEIPINVHLSYKDTYNNEFSEEVILPLKIYTRDEAIKYGFAKSVSILPTIISAIVLVLITAFWIYMIFDILRNPIKPKHRNTFWLIIIIAGIWFGALLYYFIIRKKR